MTTSDNIIVIDIEDGVDLKLVRNSAGRLTQLKLTVPGGKVRREGVASFQGATEDQFTLTIDPQPIHPQP
jgi:hypothetical protein